LPDTALEKHPESVPELLSSLRHLRETNPKAVRSTVHIYPASIYLDNGDDGEEAGANARASASSEAADRRITSWKMTEHMYFNASNPFPTLARGLFTEELEEGSLLPPSVKRIQGMQDRIVARGYDKFFNIDEVEWTNVSEV
jgi:tRNA ligase